MSHLMSEGENHFHPDDFPLSSCGNLQFLGSSMMDLNTISVATKTLKPGG